MSGEEKLVSISIYAGEIPGRLVGPVFNLLCDLGPGFTFSVNEPVTVMEGAFEEVDEDQIDRNVSEFEKELTKLINKYSLESGSDTPDYLLAEYLVGCLETFNDTVQRRSDWAGETTIIQKNGD